MRLTRAMVFGLALALGAGTAMAKEIEGVDYPDTLNVGGHDLKLVGVGLRTKWLFNVYTLGAYSKSGRKSAGALAGKNEAKFIWIRMLRKIAASKMHDAIDEGFEKNVAEEALPGLKERVATLKSYLSGELSVGLDIGFTYLPGQGTIVTVAKERKGVIEGADFAKGLFSIWFGKKPADKSLKKGVLAD